MTVDQCRNFRHYCVKLLNCISVTFYNSRAISRADIGRIEVSNLAETLFRLQNVRVLLYNRQGSFYRREDPNLGTWNLFPKLVPQIAVKLLQIAE